MASVTATFSCATIRSGCLYVANKHEVNRNGVPRQFQSGAAPSQRKLNFSHFVEAYRPIQHNWRCAFRWSDTYTCRASAEQQWLVSKASGEPERWTESRKMDHSSLRVYVRQTAMVELCSKHWYKRQDKLVTKTPYAFERTLARFWSFETRKTQPKGVY